MPDARNVPGATGTELVAVRLAKLQDLFAALRAAQRSRSLRAPGVEGAALAFARLARQPEVLRAAVEDADGSARGGVLETHMLMLTVVLAFYRGNPDITLASAGAISCILRCADGTQAACLAPAAFEALSGAAARHSGEDWPELHEELLAGTGAALPLHSEVAPWLIDYVLEHLAFQCESLPLAPLRGALALLIASSSTASPPHRLGPRLAACLQVLRVRPRLEEDVAVEALVAAAGLYSAIGAESCKAAGHLDAAEISEVHGAPAGIGDVGLVIGMVCYRPKLRKVAGAALRTLSAMVQHSPPRLAVALQERDGELELAQRKHSDSHSVNLHLVEVMLVAAATQPVLLTDDNLQFVVRALQRLPDDAEIAACGLETFLALARSSSHGPLLGRALSADLLSSMAERHKSDARVIAQACDLLSLLAEVDPATLDIFIQQGVVSLPLVAFAAVASISGDSMGSRASLGEMVTDASRVAEAAARAVTALVRRAPSRICYDVARLGGVALLLRVLQRRQAHGLGAVRLVCLSLRVLSEDPDIRRQMVDPSFPGSWIALDII